MSNVGFNTIEEAMKAAEKAICDPIRDSIKKDILDKVNTQPKYKILFLIKEYRLGLSGRSKRQIIDDIERVVMDISEPEEAHPELCGCNECIADDILMETPCTDGCKCHDCIGDFTGEPGTPIALETETQPCVIECGNECPCDAYSPEDKQ